MNMASDFAQNKKALFDEFSEFFASYPIQMDRQMTQLTKEADALGGADLFAEKALVYRAAARDCDVKVFRTSPFYFEILGGRIRNSSENGFPPGPGIEGFFMRRHMQSAESFQRWIAPYKEADLIWGDIYDDFAHHTVGYERVLSLGLEGILAEIRVARLGKPERRAFYDAAEAGLESLIEIGENFSREAARMRLSEADPGCVENLKMIEETAHRVPREPARTLYEALCTILFMREVITATEGVAVAILGGQLDRILQPYYEADLRAGRLDEAGAKNLLAHFLTITDARWDMDCQFASTNNSLTLGGCDKEGRPVYNDMTRLILEVYEEQRFVNPKIQLRLSREHPEALFAQAARMVRQGLNVFSFLNDEVLLPALTRMGRAAEDARLYVAGGCQEPILSGCEFNARAFLYISLPLLVNSCFDEKLNLFFEREGLGLAARTDYQNFESLYEAFIQRLTALFGRVAQVLNAHSEHLVELNPCPLLSATMEDCVARGLDMTEGGCRYNFTSVPLVGVGTAIDSLLALRRVVFEDRTMSLREFAALLEADFAGNESMRAYCQNRCEKFGSDSPEVNAFAARFFKDIACATSGLGAPRNGKYEASLFVFYLFDWMRNRAGATADGRRAGMSLSRGINPPDTSGMSNVACLLHTLSTLDLADFPGAGVTYLEMPASASGITVEAIASVIKAFVASGGSALDLSTLDPEALIKARKDPEAHRNLIVRVCGFSAYFTSLDKHVQDEIIARAFASL